MRFLILFIGCTALCYAHPPQHKVHLTTHDLNPYSYFVESKLTGSAVEVVKCAFNKIPYEVEFNVVPWKRAQHLVKLNLADGFFAASHNPERDKFAVMSAIIAEQKWTWYLKRNSQLQPSKADFKANAVVSSFLGANMQKWLVKNDYTILESPPINNSQLLQLLANDRVDAILANDQVMGELLSEHPKSNQIQGITNINKPLGVYFSKVFLQQHSQFLNAFNQEAVECRKDNNQIKTQN